MTVVRLGVLGGSFNPIHFGHLHIAQQSCEIFGLSQVFFVVAAVPPHKPQQALIPFAHRYAMTSLATAGHAHFLPSMIEMEPPASPYSIETLAKLARIHSLPGNELYFIGGGDSLLDVAEWHESEALLNSYSFIFIMRPGVNAPDIRATLPLEAARHVIDCRGLDQKQAQARVAAALATPECHIYLVDAGAPDIAASQIRQLASCGQRIDHLVPASVQEYILKLRLYGE